VTEDWWAVTLGLCIVGIAYAQFEAGGSLNWVAVAPAPWSSAADLAGQFRQDWPRYVAQFLAMLGRAG